MENSILTYSGTRFYPLEPISEDILIQDIAHALSLMTRANGHFKHFYSVAQHSINCYKEAKARGYSLRVQLVCLLHDASESYISDIVRPVKKHLTEYQAIEERLQKAIYEKFGLLELSESEVLEVSAVDDAMLYHEFFELTVHKMFKEVPEIQSIPDFSQRMFSSVENEFLSIFSILTGQKNGFSCLGIDACEGKWVAVYITNESFEVKKFNTVEDILKTYPNCDTAIIDIPIGLPESDLDLRPESIVRKRLGKKGSSIFGVPCRQAVHSSSVEEARKNNIEILGKSLSAQSIGFSKSIKEVDDFLKQHSQWQNRLLESHPEFCFAVLNNNEPVLEKKTEPEGQNIRLEILSQYYPNAHTVVERFIQEVPARKKVDDVIDALCLAVIGKEILSKGMKTIPEQPSVDSRGLFMQMVYAD